MSHVIHHRSKEEIDAMIQQMEAWRQKHRRTSKQRLGFLKRAGILDQAGRLSNRYGGDGA